MDTNELIGSIVPPARIVTRDFLTMDANSVDSNARILSEQSLESPILLDLKITMVPNGFESALVRALRKSMNLLTT